MKNLFDDGVNLAEKVRTIPGINNYIQIVYNKNADDYKTTGIWYFNSGNQNMPGEYYILVVLCPRLDLIQLALGVSTIQLYMRGYVNRSWTSWYKFTNSITT